MIYQARGGLEEVRRIRKKIKEKRIKSLRFNYCVVKFLGVNFLFSKRLTLPSIPSLLHKGGEGHDLSGPGWVRRNGK